MTEDFIEYVRNNYPKWRAIKSQNIDNYNEELKKELEKEKEILELLKDENVKRFSEIIGYKYNPIKRDYLDNGLGLYDYLYQGTWESLPSELNEDKYPIYCYVGFKEPLKGIRGYIFHYDDLYWNLQQRGYIFAHPSDTSKNGKNREKFKNTHDIIYAPEGKNFYDKEFFCKLQSEYMEVALEEGQEEARSMILSKYGRK